MKHKRFLGLLLAVCLLTSGCALLQLPGQVVGGTFSLLGKLVGLAGKMPMPPPGVF